MRYSMHLPVVLSSLIACTSSAGRGDTEPTTSDTHQPVSDTTNPADTTDCNSAPDTPDGATDTDAGPDTDIVLNTDTDTTSDSDAGSDTDANPDTIPDTDAPASPETGDTDDVAPDPLFVVPTGAFFVSELAGAMMDCPGGGGWMEVRSLSEEAIDIAGMEVGLGGDGGDWYNLEAVALGDGRVDPGGVAVIASQVNPPCGVEVDLWIAEPWPEHIVSTSVSNLHTVLDWTSALFWATPGWALGADIWLDAYGPGVAAAVAPGATHDADNDLQAMWSAATTPIPGAPGNYGTPGEVNPPSP